MSFLSGGLGAIFGGVTGLLGGALDAHNDRKMAQMGYDFQREVYQNQYQWKAQDAKKAGLHPLAVMGGGSYSGSPVSSGGTNFAGALGKLGEGIGDAYASYKNKEDMAVEQALREIREAEQFKSQQAETEARTDMFRANAVEARARAQSYTRPMASGREVVPGQVEASDIKPKFQRFREPDGTLSGRKPTDDYQGIHDDKPGLEYVPWIEAWYYDLRDYLDRTLPSWSDVWARDVASRHGELARRHARFNEHFPEPRW